MQEHQKYIDVAIQEIINPTLETTKQYLEVCEIITEKQNPKIARVNLSYYEDLVSVYFPIKNQEYFIEVHLTKFPPIEVRFVWTESAHKVYLTATSEKLNLEELSQYVKHLTPIHGWSKGDIMKNSKSQYYFSRLNYEPIKNLAYSLDEKLNLLLNHLEKDINAVKSLTNNSNANITVCRHQYVSGNAGIGFDIETIKRLSNLNLGIEIDTYIVGNKIID